MLPSYSLKRVAGIKGTPFPVGLVGRTERRDKAVSTKTLAEMCGSLRSSFGLLCPANIRVHRIFILYIHI